MRVEIFQGHKDWFWHLKSSNGRIIACGGEGYGTFHGVCAAVRRVFRADLSIEADLGIRNARRKYGVKTRAPRSK